MKQLKYWKQNLSGDQAQNDIFLGERQNSWWTGKAPLAGQCPGVDKQGHIHALPCIRLDNLTREGILNYFDNTWTMTEVLFSSLQGEQAFYRPPYHNLRHPMIFYYAHPAVFYINKLRLAQLISEPLNLGYEQLFDIGVDEMSWDDLSKNEMLWPKIHEITEYRRNVYSLVKDFILNHPILDTDRVEMNHPAWALMMAMEHERIHLETSSVLIRELPIELVKPPQAWPAIVNALDASNATKIATPKNKMISVPGQTIMLGKATEIPLYGWDNEYGRKEVVVNPFSASEYLISNEEFLSFVEAGGYSNPEYWSEKGWQWRCFRDSEHPVFWVKVKQDPDQEQDQKFKLRTCFEIIDMPWTAPVIVNAYEAKAYCAWRGKNYRLLTEAEHHCLRSKEMRSDPYKLLNSKLMTWNINLNYGSETEVDAFPANENGFYDVFGNVWQWSEDFFLPLPGFKPHPYYLDFSQPFFGEEHLMILGSSFISTGEESLIYSRFDFRPHFFQHAGFRIVLAAEQAK